MRRKLKASIMEKNMRIALMEVMRVSLFIQMLEDIRGGGSGTGSMLACGEGASGEESVMELLEVMEMEMEMDIGVIVVPHWEPSVLSE
jgi:hypothetical protein